MQSKILYNSRTLEHPTGRTCRRKFVHIHRKRHPPAVPASWWCPEGPLQWKNSPKRPSLDRTSAMAALADIADGLGHRIAFRELPYIQVLAGDGSWAACRKSALGALVGNKDIR